MDFNAVDITRWAALFPGLEIEDGHFSIQPGGAQYPVKKIELICETSPSGERVEILYFQPPSDCDFADIFPQISEGFHRTLAEEGTPEAPRLYLTQRAHTLQKEPIPLQAGLNFCANWQPAGWIGQAESVLGKCGMGEALLLYGPVRSDGSEKMKPLEQDALPWVKAPDSPDCPGLHLEVSLLRVQRSAPSITDLKSLLQIALTQVSAEMHLYSPLSEEWLDENPSYTPLVAYRGALKLSSSSLAPEQGDSGLALVLTAIPGSQTGELVIQGEVVQDGQSLQLETLLKLLTGAEKPLDFLPEGISLALNTIELQNVTVHLARPLGEIEVPLLTLALSFPNFRWTVFPRILELDLKAARLLVANPLDPNARMVRARLTGEVQIGGIDFDVTAAAPDFLIHAEQKAATSIHLKDFLGGVLPFVRTLDLLVDQIDLVAEPGKYYSFSMRIHESWQISETSFPDQRIIGETSFPDLQISVSSEGWELEASAPPQGTGVPVIGLIHQLADKTGVFPKFDLPEILEGLTVNRFSLAYQLSGEDFLLTCAGVLPLGGAKAIEATIKVKLHKQADGSYTQEFGGALDLQTGTGEPLQFDLTFGAAKDESAFVAVYHDPQGRQVKVDNLLQAIIETDFALGVAFSVHDVLLAYRHKKTKKENSTEQTSSTKVLFGLDVDSSLNLSNIQLPGLSLISENLLSPEQTLQLAFQLFVASEKLDAEDITFLTPLIGRSQLNLPAKGMQCNYELATTLRMGLISKQISLAIPENELPGAPAPEVAASFYPASLPAASAPSLGSGAVEPAVAESAVVEPAGKVKWISIQKSFGPLYLKQIGLNYEKGEITGVLDAALSVGGLTVSLEGLSMRTPLTKIQPTFDLNGLGIDFRNGQLEIGGAFLKQVMKTAEGQEYTIFAGQAVMHLKKLSLMAMGSYTMLSGHPSMYIYAVLDYPLGGPPFFFVTGLAAGFGYNRSLQIPSIDQVASFPLIEAAQHSGGKKAEGAGGGEKDAGSALTRMERFAPPVIGESFLAIGVKFTSFKMINSFALLIAKFGERFEIDLLGISTLTVPPQKGGAATADPLAQAELVIRATFQPDAGFLGVLGDLRPNSYILSKSCILSGGFGFSCWFSGPYEGDFVLTVGGYHPRFNVPAHYPRVKPLQLNWQVNSNLYIKGDAYFALTSHALMAGGHLSLDYSSGNLRAWLRGGLDFIIAWKPYSYSAQIYVNVGASYTFKKWFVRITASVELGASLLVWGPEFSGTACLHCYLFKISIHFGAHAPQMLNCLSWSEFRESFLPAEDELCTLAPARGLMGQTEGPHGPVWILNPNDFMIETNSALPITLDADYAPAETFLLEAELKTGPIYAAPMGTEIKTSHEVTLIFRAEGSTESGPAAEGSFRLTPITKNAPAALWGKPRFANDQVHLLLPDPKGDDRMIAKTLAGYRIEPLKKVNLYHARIIRRKDQINEHARMKDAFRWPALAGTVSAADGGAPDAAWAVVDTTIALNAPAGGAAERRAALLSALNFAAPRLDFSRLASEDALAAPSLRKPIPA